MDSDKSVTATFTRNQYSVDLIAEPQEGGAVTSGVFICLEMKRQLPHRQATVVSSPAGMRTDYWSARAQSTVSQSMVTENLKRDLQKPLSLRNSSSSLRISSLAVNTM